MENPKAQVLATLSIGLLVFASLSGIFIEVKNPLLLERCCSSSMQLEPPSELPDLKKIISTIAIVSFVLGIIADLGALLCIAIDSLKWAKCLIILSSALFLLTFIGIFIMLIVDIF